MELFSEINGTTCTFVCFNYPTTNGTTATDFEKMFPKNIRKFAETRTLTLWRKGMSKILEFPFNARGLTESSVEAPIGSAKSANIQ